MKKRLTELLLISFVLVLTIGITYARFQLTDNVTGSINVYSSNYCLENGFSQLSNCILVMENYSNNVEDAKKYISSKGNPTTNAMAPTIVYTEMIEEVSSNSVISTSAHFTLAKSYTFNPSTGMFTLNGYNNNELTDEYIGYYTCGSTTGTYDICPTLYQILEYNKETSTTGTIYKVTKAKKHTYKSVDSFDSEIGLFATNDDNGETFFYRGNVTNNYLSYAGYIWRIIRINGDGSIRIIYSGDSTEDTGSETSIGKVKYNSKYFDPTYVGYKYGENFELTDNKIDSSYAYITDNAKYYYGTGYTFDAETRKFSITGEKISGTWQSTYSSAIESYPYTCFSTTANGTCNFMARLKKYVGKTHATINYITYSSKNYESTLNNTYDSDIKSTIDYWYETNILNKNDSSGKMYSEYLADSMFCNDRSIYSGTGYLVHQRTTHSSFNRNINLKKPSLSCSQDSDKFTVANGNLKYPIALITIDEAALAGGLHNATNTRYYLYTGSTYWTMSPYSFSSGVADAIAYVWYINGAGSMTAYWVTSLLDVRPVVNLKSNVEIIRGTGTADDPYIITE